MARILIVEDNDTNRKLFRIALQKAEFEVLEATDGNEGVNSARESQPDIILMDIQLPGIDGVHAFQMLQKDPETSTIPVIAATSYAMKGDEERLLSLGFIRYLAKPISPDELIRVINEILGQSEN